MKGDESSESDELPGGSLRGLQRRHSLARARSRSKKARSLPPLLTRLNGAVCWRITFSEMEPDDHLGKTKCSKALRPRNAGSPRSNNKAALSD